MRLKEYKLSDFCRSFLNHMSFPYSVGKYLR